MYKLSEKMPQDGQRIFYIAEYDAPVVRIGFFFKLDRQVKTDQFLYRKGARYRIAGFDPMGRDKKGWIAKETYKGIGETFENEKLESDQIRYWSPCELDLPFPCRFDL